MSDSTMTVCFSPSSILNASSPSKSGVLFELYLWKMIAMSIMLLNEFVYPAQFTKNDGGDVAATQL